MVKKSVFAVLVVALVVSVGTVLWWFFTPESSKNRDAPPLTGWMQNFTPADAVGPAPQLAMFAADGKPVTFGDFHGRIVLVNFWATWCAPCIREMPSLVRLQKARAGMDFTVIALSQDLKGWEAVAPFLKKHDLSTLPVYVDEKTAIARALEVRGLPTSVLLDREGREIGRLPGHAEWDSPEALALVDFYIFAGKTP